MHAKPCYWHTIFKLWSTVDETNASIFLQIHKTEIKQEKPEVTLGTETCLMSMRALSYFYGLKNASITLNNKLNYDCYSK